MNLDHDGLPDGREGRAGFTLLELVVVMSTLAVLSALLLPALASTKPNSKAVQCLNNQKQLALAWLMYASDNSGRLAVNCDQSGTLTNGAPSWVSGVMDWGALGSADVNTDYLVNDKYSLLGGYLGRKYQVFACPATAYFVSPVQVKKGWDHRVRSVTMDAALGEGRDNIKYSNQAGYGAHWYLAKKLSDIHVPGPSDVYVFLDEHPDSLDDGIFYTPNFACATLLELPGCQHANACGVSFADGHAEMHKLQGKLANQPVKYSYSIRFPVPASDPDMLWLESHTPIK
jgi:prepilin-type N-terminal cleavage/methylation domain-containing protein/prepilin-type processing-associated H-X9-DG protein